MCGIIGYTGSEDVKGVLLDALELLVLHLSDQFI